MHSLWLGVRQCWRPAVMRVNLFPAKPVEGGGPPAGAEKYGNCTA